LAGSAAQTSHTIGCISSQRGQHVAGRFVRRFDIDAAGSAKFRETCGGNMTQRLNASGDQIGAGSRLPAFNATAIR
jgi:hypothetical protein